MFLPFTHFKHTWQVLVVKMSEDINLNNIYNGGYHNSHIVLVQQYTYHDALCVARVTVGCSVD